MLDRRTFLKFLGVAPVAVKMAITEAAFDPHRVFFDLGRGKIWTPSAQLDQLNAISQKLLDEELAGVFFTPWGLHRQADGTVS